MTEAVTYLDSSALVKLVTPERETGALRRFIHQREATISSALVRTEVVRAVRHFGPVALRRCRLVLARLKLLTIDEELLDSAALLEPRAVRTLDAIHLASALALGDELEAFVTYDRRMRTAAEQLGMPAAAPR